MLSQKAIDKALRPASLRLEADLERAPPCFKALLEEVRDTLPEADLNLRRLWRKHSLRKDSFHAQLMAVLGERLSAYRRDLRMESAARLLLDPDARDASLGEIAPRFGYVEASSFSRAFKKWSGQAPGNFRKAPAPKILQRLAKAARVIAPEDAPALSSASLQTPRDAAEDLIRRAEKPLVQGHGPEALGLLDRAETLVREHGLDEQLPGLVARKALGFHILAHLRYAAGNVDGVYDLLRESDTLYAAAGEPPGVVRRLRPLLLPTCTRWASRTLGAALCPTCRNTLRDERGRTVREALMDVLRRIPLDLEWFSLACDRCYETVWEAIVLGRLLLTGDAWRAWWLRTHADPDDRSAPATRARFLAALWESEQRTFQDQGQRLAYAELALGLALALNDPLLAAYARLFVANALRAMGRFDEARQQFRAARAKCQTNPWTAALLAELEGVLAAQANDYPTALKKASTAARLYKDLDLHLVGRALVEKGEIFFFTKDYVAASRFFQNGGSTLDDRRDPLLTRGMLPINLAATCTHFGKLSDAQALLDRCDFDREAHPGIAAAELFTHGCLALERSRSGEEGLLADAECNLSDAKERFQPLRRPRDVALADSYLIEVFARRGDRDRAKGSATQAMRAFQEIGCPLDTLATFDKLRALLNAMAIDVLAITVTVRRLAQHLGGWLPEL